MKNTRTSGYRKLKVCQEAHRLGLEIHQMSLALPQSVLYEEGRQIRRSSKSVSSNIVEGFSLRNYKKEYLRYLYLSYASAQETIEHLEYLCETGPLDNEELFRRLYEDYDNLCGMLFNLIQSVHKNHETKKFDENASD
jgi:four helix bundle protein